MRLVFIILLLFPVGSTTSKEAVKCIQGKFEPHRDSYTTTKATVCYTSFSVKKCNDVDTHMFSNRKGSSGARKSLVEALGEPKEMMERGVTECDVVPGSSAVLCRCGWDRCNKNSEQLLEELSTLLQNSTETSLLNCVKKRLYKMNDEDSCELIDDDGIPSEEGVVWEDQEINESFYDPNEELKKKFIRELRTKKKIKEWYDPWGIVIATIGIILFLTLFIYFKCVDGEKPEKRRRRRILQEIDKLLIYVKMEEYLLKKYHEKYQQKVLRKLRKRRLVGIRKKLSRSHKRRIQRLPSSNTNLLEIDVPSATTIVEMPEAVSPQLVTARSPPQEYLSQSETSSVVTTNRLSALRTSKTSTSPKNTQRVTKSQETSGTATDPSKEKNAN